MEEFDALNLTPAGMRGRLWELPPLPGIGLTQCTTCGKTVVRHGKTPYASSADA